MEDNGTIKRKLKKQTNTRQIIALTQPSTEQFKITKTLLFVMGFFLYVFI